MTSASEPGSFVDIEALLRLRHVAQSLPIKEVAANSLPGGMVHKRRGRGLEAADIRHFVTGDDVRLIDRNATARSGTLHVKSTHDERDQTALLIADFRPAMLWGTRRVFRSVAAAEALALIGWRVVANGGRVGLIALSAGEPVNIPARGRDAGMIAVIGGMARAHEAAVQAAITTADTRNVTGLAPILHFAREAMPRGTAVFLASGLDGEDEAFETAVRALDHVCPVTLLRIADAFETAPPKGRYRIEREDGSRITAHASAEKPEFGLRRYANWGISTALIDASLSPEDALRAGALSNV